MTRQIGPHSNLESLKKEAKQWLKALRAADPDALARLRSALPEHDQTITLRTVQLALAREHGAAGWAALCDSLDARERKLRELREIAEEMLRHAIFKGDHAVAARLFERHPEVATLDLFTAVAAGNLEEVERRLAADPAGASRAGGPLSWPPLLYLAYMRLPGSAATSVAIARALLDRGADPNARWSDGWDNYFTVLTGVIALGEGVKPPHERADELAELLIERGADPFDIQSFYNTSICGDDTHWLDVLWTHSERRGEIGKWSEGKRIGGKISLSALDFMLSLAVSYNHPRRAEWLLAHGANPDTSHAYSVRPLREEALVHANQAMADLLTRHGAAVAPLQGAAAFQIACRTGDFAEARRLAALHPETLRDATNLVEAARFGRRDIVELLLDLGMGVDMEDEGGVRAMNIAAGNGRIDVMKLLIERGADVDRPTKHYGGPLGFAAHFGQRAAAELLAPLSRDVHNLVYLGMRDRLRELFAAEPELVNLRHFRSGFTPLFALPAEETAALEMARFLLENGADPRLKSPAGETPATAARKRGQESVAELLSAIGRGA
jgi:ankyrin repeat protein